MFNVKVLRLKDIIKFLVGILVTIGIVIFATRYFKTIKQEKSTITKETEEVQKSEMSEETTEEKIESNSEINKDEDRKNIFSSLFNCLDVTIPAMASVNEEYNQIDKEDEELETANFLEEILKTEISAMKEIEDTDKEATTEKENPEENTENNQDSNKSETTLASTTGVTTEVVTQNPITESYNVQYGKVKIKNQTTYNLTEEILKPDITIDNKNIMIFHTHSCESYTSSEKYPYTPTRKF